MSYSHQWWPISPQPSVVPPLMAPPNLSSNFLALGWSWHWMRSWHIHGLRVFAFGNLQHPSRTNFRKPSKSNSILIFWIFEFQLHENMDCQMTDSYDSHRMRAKNHHRLTCRAATSRSSLSSWISSRRNHRIHGNPSTNSEHPWFCFFFIWRFSKIL